MRRVLIVDDDPPILRALAIALRAHDFAVETAPDARSASRQSTIDLAQEFENTLMAAADPETPPTDSTR